MRRGRPILAVLAVMVVASAAAQTVEPKGPLYDTPVYNPATKSYFELKHFEIGHSNAAPETNAEARWEWAYRLARTYTYKGTRGRLAVVPNVGVIRFIERTFRPPGPTWIGLRYWCSVKRLQWVTRRFFNTKGTRMWSKPWGPSLVSCRDLAASPYFGVAVGGPRAEGPFTPLLTAWGHQKEFGAFVVEYPTGKE